MSTVIPTAKHLGTKSPSHVTHHVLAIYGQGASPKIIEDTYGMHDYLKPVFESPDPITENNFAEHLGAVKCVQGYSCSHDFVLIETSDTILPI